MLFGLFGLFRVGFTYTVAVVACVASSGCDVFVSDCYVD